MKALEKGTYTICDVETGVVGYDLNDTWNGWAVPCFEPQVIVDWINRHSVELELTADFDVTTNIVTVTSHCQHEEPQTFVYFVSTVETVDGPREVVHVGAYNWTWTKVE